MRWGLDKDTANSNFPAAVKDLIKGRTFITSNFQYAFSHAVNTSKKQNGWPIVLSFRIRFEDLLQPDYDIRRDAPNNEKALKISREMGIYGYGGKIMPMDFETVYYSIYKHFNSDQYSSDEIRHEDAQYIYWLITTKGMNFENIVTYIS